MANPPALDLTVPRRIHVVGAGGAGMSGIATILAAMGNTVTGSDRADTATLRHLRDRGVAVAVGHAAANLGQADVVTTSSAVPPGNPELVEAARRGLRVYSRGEVLAAICAGRRTVAIAGTKGKSTTTAMVAAVLDAAGWAPSFLVGGDVPGAGGGARWVEGSSWFVLEADESDGTFLSLPAEAVVVTNVEADHLDFHGSIEALRAAFAAFASRAPGPRVVGVDSPYSAELAGSLGRPARTFGTGPGADVRATRVTSGRFDSAFDVEVAGSPAGRVTLGVPGVHNVRNACGVVALALELGVPLSTAAAALAGYRPVARRFDWRGERRGVTVVDDYAHVPSALRAVIETARGGGWERVVAVFQPHLYSRTVALGAELGAELARADVVVVADVYGSREAPVAGVTGQLVADAALAARPGLECHYVAERAELAGVVAGLLRPGDLCLTIGAGDVTTLADELFSAWQSA